MTRVVHTGGGITAPAGFRAAGVACGIKREGPDLALLVSDCPAAAAGLFTTNRAQAAPVVISREHLRTSRAVASAIVTNSGCANACTGTQGIADARGMAGRTARALGCAVEHVLVASTGVIGVALDMAKIGRGIPDVARALARTGHHDAARAIMTTDPWPKEAAVRVDTGAGTFHVGGMAKGSGMIEPMLATMLGFLTTDAAVTSEVLRRALTEAADETFNAITVDGECSTNDSLFVLANGASQVMIDDRSYPILVEGLREVSHELAVAIVRGGEGATKTMSIHIAGAVSKSDARRAARTIANSPLVKTAVHGNDPNWGRLIAAAGRAGVQFDVERASVAIGPVVLFRDGCPHDGVAPEAATYLQRPEVELRIDLGAGGSHQATMWTCDLSAEYVRINADYRT